jgi:phosphate transport system substrate-binding protein
MRHVLSLTLLAAIVLLAACGTPAAPSAEPTEPAPTATEAAQPTQAAQPTAAPELSGEISVAGSTSVQPLAEVLGEDFMAAHPQVVVNVQGGGSSVGVKSAGEGTVNVGTASRDVKPEELQQYPDLKVYTIARDGVAIVTNPQVPIDGLTKEQVKEIFSGEITNWSEVGGPDKSIVVVSREEGSGTRAYFEEAIMGEGAVIVDTAILQQSNGALRTTVSTTPDSIGFLSFGYLDESVKALALDGVEATVANALNGTYPVVRPFNMLTNGQPSDLVQAWLDFILSAEGQHIAKDEGYLPIQ